MSIISFSELRSVFSNTTSGAVSMSQYYRNASDKLTTGVSGIPVTSQSISASQLYNKSRTYRYPPASLSSGGTGLTGSVTLTNLAYGNGTYSWVATSQYDTTQCPSDAFDMDAITWPQVWTTAGRYDNTNGNYIGSVSTTVSGTAHLGEYIQLQMPHEVNIAWVTLTEVAARRATSAIIAGSNDGSTWTLITTYADTTALPGQESTIDIDLSSNTSFYKYYRFIIKKIDARNQFGFYSLYEIEYRARLLPTTSGLIGYYHAESYNNGEWVDISGSRNQVNTVNGTITSATYLTTPRKFISGGTTANMTFPTGILPSTYTLFHIAKYNGTTTNRIFTGVQPTNWLSGFWANLSGVAYHSNWITQSSTSVHGSNWVLSVDQNSLYRSNKVTRTTGSPGTPSNAQLGLNIGFSSVEKSDWAVALVIVFNRTLTSAEFTAVENFLSGIYTNF